MSEPKKLTIIEEPNIIDDHLLDIIGNEFRFDHEKGLAEWLKNSKDAYTRSDISDSEQAIIFHFVDGKKNDAVFECIDFVGMDETDIEKAFKRWGDPEAAKRGLKKRVYGGHGNGGKFYMRQMFERSYFVTYKNGKISIFGFNENRKYGFADGYKNKSAKPTDALRIAGIDSLTLPQDIRKKVIDGHTGFTVVHGIGPSKMKNVVKFNRIVETLKNHPQARRILSHVNVWAIHNDDSDPVLLKPDEIKTLTGFEKPRQMEVPKTLEYKEGRDKNTVEMANEKYSVGMLILKTSEEAFGKGSRAADLNRIDIIGEIGVIASYQVFELGVTTFPQASFIYGECECPILEDPEMDAVKNDRSKLVENNPRANALLSWLRERVDEYAREIAAVERKEQEANRRQISVAYNDFLNKWKDKFMTKFLGEVLGGSSGSDGGKDGTGNAKRILELPENGLAFSVPHAEISQNQENKLTLKASVPNPIPLGSVIKLSSSSNQVVLAEERNIVRSESVKATPLGETVAVLNIIVVGKKIGTEAKIKATVGKLSTEMTVKVIEASESAKEKKPKTPQVLLSGIHQDPLNLAPDNLLILTDRDPLVYQRYQDAQENIYWINTQSPLAKGILDRDGDDSIRWRDYLFQRYVDIFVKQMLHKLQNKDPESFRADHVDNELDILTRKIHTAAMNDLGSFFFEEEFKVSNEQN